MPFARLRSRRYSPLELVVIITLLGLLGSTLFSRLTILQERAEQVAVEQVLGNLRSALSLKIAEKVAQNRYQQLAELRSDNPFDWLAEYNTLPINYHGNQDVIDIDKQVAGTWMYENSTRDLVYKVQSENAFHTDTGSPPHLRFRIFFQYSAKKFNGLADIDRNNVSSVELRPLSPYKVGANSKK